MHTCHNRADKNSVLSSLFCCLVIAQKIKHMPNQLVQKENRSPKAPAIPMNKNELQWLRKVKKEQNKKKQRKETKKNIGED